MISSGISIIDAFKIFALSDPKPFETGKSIIGYSGGSRNFKTGGVSFDAPSHIPYVFVARSVNKIHNVNIVY